MRTFGLIGYPLTHSFSQKYFTEKFRKEKIDAEYLNFPISSIDQFPALIEANPNLEGLSITIPYKTEIIKYLDELDETARVVGAVNCIKIGTRDKGIQGAGDKGQGTRGVWLKGFNTDVYGFSQSIKPFLENTHQRALILGTGGASKAVDHVLKQIGLDTYKVSRKKTSGIKQFSYEEITKYVLDSFTLIVNTTPLGTFPNVNEFPPIPYEHLSSKHLLFDLVYNPEETMFMKKGKEAGATVINGLSMLHLQADEAWRIFSLKV